MKVDNTKNKSKTGSLKPKFKPKKGISSKAVVNKQVVKPKPKAIFSRDESESSDDSETGSDLSEDSEGNGSDEEDRVVKKAKKDVEEEENEDSSESVSESEGSDMEAVEKAAVVKESKSIETDEESSADEESVPEGSNETETINDSEEGEEVEEEDKSGDSASSSSESDSSEAKLSLPFELKKDFYVEADEIKNKTWEEVRTERKLHTIKVKGSDIPNLISQFSHLTLPEAVQTRLDALKFEKPTPIQAQGLPVALSGKNMVGVAETGSGKTLVYLLPSILHIKAQPKVNAKEGPIALILAPTRELVQQIKDELRKLIKGSNITYACVYGGIPMDIQKKSLESGVQLIIATPGRLLDLMKSEIINLSRVTYLVLDEADRMLDMGFEVQLKKVVEKVQDQRQTLMFSATWPDSVKELAFQFLSKFVYITVGKLALQSNKNISQKVVVCENKKKLDLLTDQLTKLNIEDPQTKILIFVATKTMAQKLAEYLNELTEEANCAQAIHGDKTQFQRDLALKQFKSTTTKILVATDLASRGLDIPDVKVVINYDMPTKIEDYVHRIGRTGRAGNLGTSVSYFTQDDGRLVRPLMKLLKETNSEIDPQLVDISNMEVQGFTRPQEEVVSNATASLKRERGGGEKALGTSITKGATTDRRTSRSQGGKPEKVVRSFVSRGRGGSRGGSSRGGSSSRGGDRGGSSSRGGGRGSSSRGGRGGSRGGRGGSFRGGDRGGRGGSFRGGDRGGRGGSFRGGSRGGSSRGSSRGRGGPSKFPKKD